VTPNVDDSLQADRSTSGSVDIGTPTGPGLTRFTGNTNYERATVPRGTGGSNCISTYAFNLWPKGMTAQTIAAKPLDAPYEHPIFKDAAVRKAIFLGVDRTGSIKKIDFDQGKLATAPFHSELFGYASQQLPGNDSTNNDADVAAANTALDQAGWVDSNNDGTRDKGGVELAFDLTHFDTSPQADYGKQFVADMAKLKIKVTDRPLTNANQQTALSTRDYDMSIISYCNGDDPVIGVRRQYHSTQVTNTSFVNTAGYRSAAMDADWDKAIASDTAGAQAAYRDVQTMAVRDLPYIWVTETATVRVNRTVCKGFNNNNTGLFIETAHCD
jgi:peptide/nickel transport system substrate-binding protein